jgi:hypothetical protein
MSAACDGVVSQPLTAIALSLIGGESAQVDPVTRVLSMKGRSDLPVNTVNGDLCGMRGPSIRSPLPDARQFEGANHTLTVHVPGRFSEPTCSTKPEQRPSKPVSLSSISRP